MILVFFCHGDSSVKLLANFIFKRIQTLKANHYLKIFLILHHLSFSPTSGSIISKENFSKKTFFFTLIYSLLILHKLMKNFIISSRNNSKNDSSINSNCKIIINCWKSGLSLHMFYCVLNLRSKKNPKKVFNSIITSNKISFVYSMSK